MTLVASEKCTGCEACYNCCPTNAISMVVDKEGFYFPKIDKTKCISCNLCKKTCPSLNYKSPEHECSYYACIANDVSKRITSSSGGVFELVAKKCLSMNGVVYGVALDNANLPVMERITKMDDIYRLKGSKYVQATIGDSYRRARIDLDNNRKVLFVGTPCQIAGLKAFLNKDYVNLMTVDLICHGVPSGQLFLSYIHENEKKNNSKVVEVHFRDKTYGWNRFGMRLKFQNGKEYCKPNQVDPWMLAFNDNIMLRESCYSCQYKTIERISDITLGDLWGIDAVAKEMNDNMGVSLVIVQSNKGYELLKEIESSLSIKRIEIQPVIHRNSFHSIDRPDKRDDFINAALNQSFNTAYRNYVKRPTHNMLMLNMRLILSNIKRKLLRGM